MSLPTTNRKHRLTLFALGLLAFAAACTESGQPSPAILDYALSAAPSDARIAEIYQRSCMACHSRSTSGAPLTGHHDAWNTRMEQGMETLVSNVVSGMGAMPPYGLCMDCSVAEFQALIGFMSTPAQP